MKHNLWFYYYVLTAMLASINIFILSVNLLMLIPYPFISSLLIVVSTIVFFVVFIGLLVLCISVAIQADSTIPPRQMSEWERLRVCLVVLVSMVLFTVGLWSLAQYEELTSRPLVMVGIMLTGRDLLIFSVVFAFSSLPQDALLRSR